MSVLVAACGPATPAAPAGVELIPVSVRNATPESITVTITAPALTPPVQGGTLTEGSSTVLYIPTEGRWQFDLDGRAFATDSRLDAWTGCPISVDVLGNGPGPINWACAE